MTPQKLRFFADDRHVITKTTIFRLKIKMLQLVPALKKAPLSEQLTATLYYSGLNLDQINGYLHLSLPDNSITMLRKKYNLVHRGTLLERGLTLLPMPIRHRPDTRAKLIQEWRELGFRPYSPKVENRRDVLETELGML